MPKLYNLNYSQAMKNFHQILCISILILFSTVSFAQGVTNSSIGGQIKDNTGEPLPGGNIVAIHVPSGAQYGASTDFDGFYRISNMRSGGPYNVTISYVGFEEYVLEGINLQLGESKRISTQMVESAEALEEVVITAQSGNGVFDANKTGAGTRISRRQVEALPNVSRSIADFVRLTPQAQIREDNEISIAGQNNRYNSLYIDGTINNDVFGLAGSGTNGGQTGVNPISVDAIESFQVNVAPYDVKIGGFAGGAINAVTKSGTNEFSGGAYYLYRNQDLAGKTPGDVENREKLAEFTAQTYGVNLGGPLIEDELFFFLNYERQNDETPLPFDGVYIGDSGLDGVAQLSNFLQETYGYNTGDFQNNINSLESDKILLKLDWNVSDRNKISLRNNYVEANQISSSRSTASTINFENGGLEFKSVTNTASLEWSYSGDNVANKLILGYTTVRDDRGILGDPLPRIEINDGDGRIFAGSEPFSTANKLDTDVFTLTNNFEIFSGQHTITIGTHNEYTDVANTFFGRNFGEYTYNSLDEFFANDANEYRSSYSLIGGVGDDSQGIAEFDMFQLGFYLQDEIQFTDDFKLTMGLRFDVPIWSDGRENTDFNGRTINLLEAAGKDLQGARVGQGPDNSTHVSPRLGFNWNVDGKSNTQVRGGLGIFTSRIPLVWPGGAYNNTGTTIGVTRIFRPRPGSTSPNLVPEFNPDVTTQFQEDRPFQGNVDLLAKDLKLPQTFKYSIAVDQKIPGGITLTGEVLFNETVNAVNYENLNLEGPQFTTTGAGSRSNYGFELVDDTYEGIFLISNTSAGSSWNASLTASKNVYSSFLDLTTAFTYSYGESDVLFEGTSSQNISNWAFNESVNGSNALQVSTSDFDQGHRVIGSAVVDFKWSENTKTRIGLFYEGAEGTPFSFVIGGRNNLINDTGESFVALPFIPSSFEDSNLVDATDRQGNVTATAEEQYAAFDAFISDNDYLNSRRGQFAERNGARSRWSHIVDLKFEQEFSLNINNKKHSLAITADIFNFTNLINKDWGIRYFASGFDTATLLNFQGFADDNTTPEFTFNSRVDDAIDNVDDAGLRSSRWQMQFGVRYSF